jgi:elongation factor Ts
LVDGSGTIQDLLTQSVAELGENIQFAEAKRFQLEEGVIGSYIHMTRKIGVLVPLATNSPADKDLMLALARDIAMHIAATPAEAVLPEQVDQSVLDKERDVFVAQARESGKPDNIIEKMVSGRIQKFLKEICVGSQPFVKNPQRTVQQLVDDKAKELGVEIKFDSFAKFNF